MENTLTHPKPTLMQRKKFVHSYSPAFERNALTHLSTLLSQAGTRYLAWDNDLWLFKSNSHNPHFYFLL